MKIVVLDGYTENPGDLSWAPLEALGDDLLDFFLRQFHMIEHSSVCSPSAC